MVTIAKHGCSLDQNYLSNLGTWVHLQSNKRDRDWASVSGSPPPPSHTVAANFLRSVCCYPKPPSALTHARHTFAPLLLYAQQESHRASRPVSIAVISPTGAAGTTKTRREGGAVAQEAGTVAAELFFSFKSYFVAPDEARWIHWQHA